MGLDINFNRIDLGGRTILRDIHVNLPTGTFAGLLGPNGAGKTTLVRAILGLIDASGTATLSGKSGAELRRNTGFVPQKHETNWDFPISVADCVASGRTGLRRDRDACAEAITLADLNGLESRPIAQLSGGQRQRVLVARALARQPELLILDEPFTGVDTPTAEQLLVLFRQLADSGTTVLMSSHDLGETVDNADVLLLLNETLVRGDTATPEPWIRTFGVSPNSALLRTVGVA